MVSDYIEQEKVRQKPVYRRYNSILDRLIIARFGTKEKFSKAVGCSRSLISQIVHGHTKPDLQMKLRIAKILGEDSRTIFPEEK